MKESKNLTLHFTLQQIVFWAAYCCITTFGVTCLLSNGFKASEAGIVLFLGNFTSFAIQPFLATKADKAKKNLIPFFIILLGILSIICMTVLYLAKLPKVVFAVFYFLSIATLDMELPFFNSLVVYYNTTSWNINYGIGRGIGSAGYGVASLVLGSLMAKNGTGILFPIAITLAVLYTLATLMYPKEEGGKNLVLQDNQTSFVSFVVRYKWYSISLIGQFFLAIAHLMLENYLIEIVAPLNGNSSNVGLALFIATITETVVLLFISRIHNCLGSKKMIMIACYSYILKAMMFFFAGSMWVIYIGELLQMTSYTFLQPIQVYYATECTNKSDMIKAQALSTSLWTVGCAFGNLFGGVLITAIGLKLMLLSSVGVAVAGTVVFMLSLSKALNLDFK